MKTVDVLQKRCVHDTLICVSWFKKMNICYGLLFSRRIHLCYVNKHLKGHGVVICCYKKEIIVLPYVQKQCWKKVAPFLSITFYPIPPIEPKSLVCYRRKNGGAWTGMASVVRKNLCMLRGILQANVRIVYVLMVVIRRRRKSKFDQNFLSN